MKEMHYVHEWFHQEILREKPYNFLLTRELENDFDQVHIYMGCFHVTPSTTQDRPGGTIRVAPHFKDYEMKISKFKHITDVISNMLTKSATQQ